jgi:hypothetical protein
LKNRAEVVVAPPAIEVSLQDSSDTTLVRRVLLPSETGLPPDGLPPRAELPITLPISLQEAGNAVPPRIAGYRVLAFYP